MFEKLEQRTLLTAELQSDGVVEVRGTDGNDDIRLRVSAEQLTVSEDGSDTSFALSDVTGIRIRAGDGDDRVQLEADVMGSEIEGEGGGDTLIGGDDDDTLRGGAGDDHLDGKLGADIFDGGNGFDSADYGFRSENLVLSINNQGDDGASGGAEGDNIQVDMERVVGGAGDDLISGSDENNSISAGEGKDTVGGGLGNDSIDGDEGDDWLIGEQGDDRLTGGPGGDLLQGNGGDDTFLSEDGERDVVEGGPGNDRAENGDGGLDQFDDVEDTPGVPRGEITVRGVNELVDGESEVDFGVGERGEPGPTRAFTVRNDGKATLTLGNIVLPDGFTLIEDIAASLAPSESDTFTIRMDTNSLGPQAGQVRIGSNDEDEDPFNFRIFGTVDDAPQRAPDITVSRSGTLIVDGQSNVGFGSVLRNALGPEQTFLVRNDGNATLFLGVLQVPLGFIVTDALAPSLAPSETDEFTIRLATAVVGDFGGPVRFTTNDPDEDPFNFDISGIVSNKTPVQRPEISVRLGNRNVNSGRGTIGFGKARQGGSGPTRSFTVSNNGTGTLALGSLTVPSGFAVVEGLSGSLGAGQSDSFTVQMNTSRLGAAKGTIRFSNNDANENPFRIKVSGSVTRVALAKMTVLRGGSKLGNGATINFGSVTAGQAAKLVTLTVRNDGNAKLSVGTVRAPAGFSISKAPPRTLGPKKSGTLTIRMAANGSGTKSGTIELGSGATVMSFTLQGTVKAPGGGGGGGGDPIDARVVQGTLIINGTGTGDSIVVRTKSGATTVTLNGGTRTFNNVQRIAVKGLDGNDNINLSGTSLPSAVDGGNGNDTIQGGGGADNLHGFFGNDSINGGFGADQIFGDDGDDILDARDGTHDIRVDGGNGNDVINADPTDTKTGT